MAPEAPSPGSEETGTRTKATTVLQAARKVFFSHGFSAATTDMIQQEAGVSKATVYAHYANKEALFAAVLTAQIDASMQTMRDISHRPGKLKETLQAFARTYLGIVLSEDSLALCRVAIAEARRFPDLSSKFYVSGPAAMAVPVAQALVQAVAAKDADLGGLAPSIAATLFLSLVRNDAQLRCLTHANARPSSAQLTEWAASAVTLFVRAIAIDRDVQGNAKRKARPATKAKAPKKSRPVVARKSR
ncbi:transcriptional regulator, TetR family [Variovorax sp. OK605]|nr:transcriptional regulator, TetR family [Variovorax sp. OK605]